MSAHAMLELVRCSTVRIERAADRAHLGTGFFAADALVLTAAHVVAAFRDQPAGVAIVWDGESKPCSAIDLVAEPPIDWRPGVHYPWPDAAILAVDHRGHPCVRLSDAWPVELPPASLYAWAYAADYDPRTVGGTSVGVDYIGPVEPEPGAVPPWRLLNIRSNRIIGGMSGAPLLDADTLKVCAIMKSSRNVQAAEGGYATAIADVVAKRHLPAVARLLAGQQEYLASVGLDASAEAKVRWGELPARVATIIARRSAAEAFANELNRRGHPIDLTRLPADEHNLRVAQHLFGTDVNVLALVLSDLAENRTLEAEDALEIFETVACCLPVEGSEKLAWWIPPEAAEQLFREVSAHDPRIAHVPTDERDTIKMLVRRASGRSSLKLFESETHSNLTPEPDSLFKAVEHVIREAVPGAREGWHENSRMRARVRDWVRDRGLVLRLPPIALQQNELDELRDGLGTFPFVLGGRTASPASPRVVRIEPEIDAGFEQDALLYHGNLQCP